MRRGLDLSAIFGYNRIRMRFDFSYSNKEEKKEEKEKKARRDYMRLMKEKFENGEISEEEYFNFREQMRKERKG